MKIIQTLFILLIISSFSFAQNREHAFDVNQRLGRGINYGNMFEAPSESDWGNPWKPQYAGMIAKLGFNHVRIPIRWEPAARSLANAPYTINASFLNRIKMVVDSALHNKLHVIINMHHHEALYENPEAEKARFLSQWDQISTYFAGYSDSLLFEVLNEPHGNLSAEKWNVFFADALTTIRKTNPARIVLMGTANYGGLGGLPELKIPNDQNIIVTVHYYNPFQFTHQGANWVGTDANAWLGTKWNDSETEREIVQNEFAPLLQFGKTNKVPIHIGEFGAYSTADEKSRTKWTTYIGRYLETLGWSWAYWEFSAGFGIYNPSKYTYNQYLVDALLHNTMPEPSRYVGTAVYKSNFSISADGWNLNRNSASGSAATLTRADNTLLSAITNGGTEGWHIQLVKNNLAITAGKKYRISFRAKTENSRSATVYLGMNKDPWSAYSGYNGFSLADTFALYTFVFDAQISDNAARMVFDIGKSTEDFWVKDILLEEIVLVPPTGVENIQEINTALFPNPVSDRLFINNTDGFHFYTITDIRGNVIKKGELVPLLNRVDMENYSPGFYILKLSGKRMDYSAKILKK